jgi:hypothetical protein
VPAYNGYSYGGDDPDNYLLGIYPEQGRGFNSGSGAISASAKMDGVQVDTLQTDRDQILLSIPWRKLRPGRHSITLDFTGTYNGVRKSAKYDLPFVVPMPTPIMDGQMFSVPDLQVGKEVNFVKAGDKDITLYVLTRYAFVSTEVVLDDVTVLPSVKLYNNKPILPGDPNEENWYFSGNNVISFTIPAAMTKRLAGSYHTVRLRSMDYNGQSYILSNLQANDNQKMFFYAGVPKIQKINLEGKDGILPLKQDFLAIEIMGDNFTPNTTARLSVGGTEFDLRPVFQDPNTIHCTIPLSAIDYIQSKNATTGDFRLATPEATIPATGGSPLQKSGGKVSASRDFEFLKPNILALEPGRAIRGKDVTFTVIGENFVCSNFFKTRVRFDGELIAGTAVKFNGNNRRDFTEFKVTIPASTLIQAGPHELTIDNGSPRNTSAPFRFVVLNAAPKVTSISPLKVKVDGKSGYVFEAKGGLFYKDSIIYLDGIAMDRNSWQADKIQGNLKPVPLQNLNGEFAYASVITPTPGGGQSEQFKITLLEGLPSTVEIKKGATVYDRKTDTYRQSYTMTYRGSRLLENVVVRFGRLGNSTLVNSNIPAPDAGIKIAANLRTDQSVKFDAVFKRSGNKFLAPEATVSIVD